MTAMIEYFKEEKSGLLIAKEIFRDSETGKFKALILPKGEEVWFSIGIRVTRWKLDLECLSYTFHFTADSKGQYFYRNGQGDVPVNKEASEHLHELARNLHSANIKFKERTTRRKASMQPNAKSGP